MIMCHKGVEKYDRLHWSTIIEITFAALVGLVPGDLSSEQNPSVRSNFGKNYKNFYVSYHSS
jgi:hypothetical protein